MGAGLRLGSCTQFVRSGGPWLQRLASPVRRRMGSVGDWPLARPTQEQRENAAAREPRMGRRGGPRRSSRGGYAPRASRPSGRGRRPGESRGGWRMPCGGGPAMPARPQRAVHRTVHPPIAKLFGAVKRVDGQPRRTIVIWLILPVVICLSQRLSHACLSISNYTAKLRMAHYISYRLFDSALLHG